MRRIIATIFGILTLTPILSQFKGSNYHSREVIVQSGDTLIRTSIITGEFSGNPDMNKTYYWYSKGMINSNKGGFAGKLLNGKYLGLLNNKLIESGELNKGLKTGVWKCWYSSGRLKSYSKYTKGILSGKYYSYSETGIIEKSGIYRRGLYHSRLKNSETKLDKKIVLLRFDKAENVKSDSTLNKPFKGVILSKRNSNAKKDSTK